MLSSLRYAAGVGAKQFTEMWTDGSCISENPGSPVTEITDVAQAESVSEPEQLFANAKT